MVRWQIIYLKVSAYNKKLCCIIKAGFGKSWNIYCVFGGYGHKEMLLKGFIFMNINQHLFSFSLQIFSPCTVRHLVHKEHYKKTAGRQDFSHPFSPHFRAGQNTLTLVIGHESLSAERFGTIYCTFFCVLPLTAHTTHQGTVPCVFSS